MPYFLIGFLLVFIIICCKIYSRLSSNRKAHNLGEDGERLIVEGLKQLRGGKIRILQNMYLPKNKNGDTTEIDIVMIRNSGIYVIESKNYSGWIFGSGEGSTWTQCLGGGKNIHRYYFQNPVYQNKLHIRCIKEYLNLKNVPIYSVIVFSERCRLQKVEVSKRDAYVIKLSAVIDLMKKLHNRNKKRLTTRQVNAIYKQLAPRTHVSRAVKRKHIAKIKKSKRAKEKKAKQKLKKR